MKVEVRRKLSPQEFIRQLFAETKEGKVSIEYAPSFDEPYTMTEVADLEFFSETETLTEEEQAILDRHYTWYEANSLKRLPAAKCAPTLVNSRARRYEHTVSLGAPAILIAEDGRSLAEELALYYHQIQRPKPDFTRFIDAQVDTYKVALEEVRNGRKETHWMWFVFPQLRGLGQSQM